MVKPLPPLYHCPHDVGRRYLAEVLEMGDELSRALTDWLPPDLRFFTLTPVGDDREYKLTEGGLKPTLKVADTEGGYCEQVETDDERLALLLSTCSAGRLGAVVLEDILKRRGDAVLERCRCDVHYVGDEVLHVEIGLGPLSVDRLVSCIREARTLPRSLGVFSTLESASAERLRRQETYSAIDVAELVGGARILFSSAFDGESYLVGLTPDAARELSLEVEGREGQ